jgi:hypothetical protein
MQEINWPYSFAAASEDKGTWKSGSQSLLWEIAGIDGTNQGSLTPHPGYREAWTFRYDQIPGADFGGTNPYVANAPLAKVIDFWPFTCRVGSNAYAYGVVYICQRPNSSTRDLLIEGYRTDSSSYFQKIILQASALLGTGNTDYGVYVTATPRVVYVGVRDNAGFAVTFPTGAVNIVTSGPGVKPQGTWDSTSFTAYTTTVTQLPDPGAVPPPVNPPGSFVVYSTSGATAPTNWADTSVRWGTAAAQKAGDYAFAVQFEDSLSGRRSQLSDSVAVTFTGATRKFTVTGIVDTAKYDTVKVWRSVRTVNAAGVFAAGILQLEATFKATDYPVNSRTGPVSYATAWAYAVQKDDRQLVMQDTFQDKPSFYSEVPHGGAGMSFQSQLYVSDIKGQDSDTDDQMRSVGEIRWSSAADGSYELFAPKARWNPDMYGDVPITFQQAGQILLGFSRNRVFFILRDGAFVRVSTAHNGYGVTGPYSAATIGPIVYYVTKQGMRAVYPDGRLDEIGALDWLFSKDWTDDLSRVSMAYDPDTTCLYVMNPVNGKAVTLWFSSGVASEMHYMPFRKCARGFFPRTAGGELRDCAMFLMSPDLVDDASVTITNFRPRLMICAETPTDRVHTPSTLNTYEGVHHGMIDGPCDRNFLTSSIADVVVGADTYYRFRWATRTNGWTPDWRIIGAYVRLVGLSVSVNADKYTHTTFQVIGIGPGTAGQNTLILRLVPDIVDVFFSAEPNIYTTVNPVVVKVQTANVPGQTPESGFLVNKQISSAGVLMSGVEASGSITGTGNSVPAFGRWYLNLYESDDTVPVLKSAPQNPSATVAVRSVIDGPSPVHAAFSARTLMPHQSVEFMANAVNQTFRLLAMNVRGRILETERNKNSYA